ncbi:MAG TPA: adenylate/guanylate cyclase domain-containing protein [Solirubrobacteraceae bacterium]|nr:adenylate/guanylate cyclase domain-containing protein [Solirubrobacteraceae bacterium]
MNCPNCQAENKEGAKFCSECGTPLALRCPRCGAGHRPGQKFCDECGLALGAGAPADTPAPAPASAAAIIPDSAELRLVSVLFVDLVGFTALSESREAEDVRELLGRYFDSARTIVERYGGTIEKFIGDAVMAVWGVPVAREDDAERAVRAALEVVDAVQVLGEKIQADSLRARAGVVTGQVAALENPGEGLVVGDRVNTASRVQSAAQPGSVYVDEVTRQVTSAGIAYEDAGQHDVKGKAEPLRLWRALRVVAGIGGAEREQGVEAPFVGRDADLRLIKELFHGALERRSARLVAVFGEAGVGKSRLRREFSNYLDGLASGILWHDGRCLSYGEGVAYWALAEMVRQRMGISEEAGGDDAGARLTAGLERWIPDAGDREFLAPRLGALLGVSQPGLSREELFAGWRLFFERLAAHQPVVLVFEDVQWADDGLLDFIEQLLEWSSASPIFILALSRPDLAARPQGWPAGRRGATALQLEPLSDESMRELLHGVLDGLPPAAEERIISQAEGIPLFAIETIRALVDRGVVAEQDGRLVMLGELGELDVPATLGSLLAARLDALDPLERRLVKAMSVFGGAFPRSAAVALGDVPEQDIDQVLEGLVRKQVLVIRSDRLSPDRGQYAFAQGLLRTVAHGLLSRQERKPRHLAAADYLRQAFANDGEEVAEMIASHHLEAYHAAADDPDADELRTLSIAALSRAADRALAIGAPEVAERSLRTAAELASDPFERGELVGRAGRMALESGRTDAALELLSEAIEIYTSGGDPKRAARLAAPLGQALGRQGRAEEAVERARAALEVLADDPPDAEIGLLHWVQGRSSALVGRYEEGILAMERSLSIAEALKLPDLLAQGLNGKATMYVNTARVEEARLLLAGAADIARQHGRTIQLSRAEGNLGNVAMEWDLPDAAERLENSYQVSLRIGDRYGVEISVGNLMLVHIYRGLWEEVMRYAKEASTDGENETGHEDVQQRLVLLRSLRGELDQAAASLAQLAGWEHTDERESFGMYGCARLALQVAEGAYESALEQGLQVVQMTLESLAASNENMRNAWPDTFQAALKLGRLDAAADLLRLLGERPPGHIPPYLNAQLARGRALLAIAEGRHDAVEDDLNHVIAQLRELGYPYWLAVAQTDLGEWLISQGRSGEAEPLLDEAADVLRRLGAAPALARVAALRSVEAPASHLAVSS